MKSKTVVATVALALVAVGAAAFGLRRGDAPRAYALSDGDDFHQSETLGAAAVYAAKVRLERVGDRGLLLTLRGVESKDFPPLPAQPFPQEPVDVLRMVWFRAEDGSLRCPLPRVKDSDLLALEAEASVVFPKAPERGEAPPAALHLTLDYELGPAGKGTGAQRLRKSFRFDCVIPTDKVARMSGALREATALSTQPLRLVRCATAKDGETVGDLTPGVELLASLAP
jgi:hypothetical protein